MKTVIFIITKSEIGGAQSWVYEQAKIVSSDCKVILVTSEDGWLTRQSVFSKVYILPGIAKLIKIPTLFKLINIIKDHSTFSVVSSSANAGVYARLARLFIKFKCVYVSHGWSCLYNGGSFRNLFCKIEKYLSILTDTVWCVSKSDRDKAIGIIGINENKIITSLNSITPLAPKLDGKFMGRVLFVGRLTHPKRPELIADVIANNKRYSLDIIGDGDLYPELYKRYGECENISFLGEISDFRDFYKYDVFVLTSDSEGLPMSALEAGSSGLPMILSNVGGCFEVIGGENGILVSNDVLDVRSALDAIADNYNYYCTNAMNYKDNFNISLRADEYKKIIIQY